MRLALLGIVLSLLSSSPASAQLPKGTFDTYFNHQNWRVPPFNNTNPNKYRYSVEETAQNPQWTRARNDLAPCAQQEGGPWVRAMHLSLIPPTPPIVGTHPTFGLGGRVLVWDGNENNEPDGYQFWSIVDPTLPIDDFDKFWNFELAGLKAGGPSQKDSDFGCAGHTWTKDRTLFMAAGTSSIAPIQGTYFVYEFDPRLSTPGNAMWTQFADMQTNRWYPSCALAWDEVQGQGERILVPGGTLQANPEYEAFDRAQAPFGWQGWGPAGANLLFQGPESIGRDYLHFYPRLHLLSDGFVYRSGMHQDGVTVHHVDGPGAPNAVWHPRGVLPEIRSYGASLLYPNIDAAHTDLVVVLGGEDHETPGVNLAINTVHVCKGTAQSSGTFPGGYAWDPNYLPDMQNVRVMHNAVILPDASIVVFGGLDHYPGGNPVKRVERHVPGGMFPAA